MTTKEFELLLLLMENKGNAAYRNCKCRSRCYGDFNHNGFTLYKIRNSYAL